MANIFTNLNLTADSNFFITQKINSIGYVGENTVTRLNIEVPEITDGATYELETENSAGEKNVALLSTDAENNTLYLDFTANMLTVNDLIMMQLRVTYVDNSIKKSNRFAMKIAKSISATDYYEEYAVTIFDQLVQDCRDIIEGAESYAVRAETAATNAEAYEQSASASAEAASVSEATATSASVTAVNAAASAESASTSAHTSAETATTAAASASASATTATSASESAQAAASTATTASTTAVNASATATTAATSAENSATSASTAANNASASATSAASSANNASNSATSATTAASNAATSETNAAASASSASTSAANANTSATNAANSASAAATSATNAHASEVNASTSETNASTSATEAAEAAETVASSIAQINENTYRINDLEAIIGGYTLTDLPTGAMATITNGTALLMPSLKVGIEPVQDLHGYDHPWTGGAGKNLFDIYAEYTIGDTAYAYEVYVKPNTSYTLSSNCPYVTPANLYFNGGSTEINGVGADTPKTFNSDENGKLIVYVRFISNYPAIDLYTAVKNGRYYIQLEEGSTATTYEPYSNICPISGWTAANVIVSPTTSAEDGTTYTIQFTDDTNPLTVYGGTLDAISGLLTVTDAYIASYNGETLPSTWISDRDVYAAGTTPTIGAEVCYELATPTTYQLTPAQVRTLVGNNNIWADTGDIIEGKYYRSPF